MRRLPIRLVRAPGFCATPKMSVLSRENGGSPSVRPGASAPWAASFPGFPSASRYGALRRRFYLSPKKLVTEGSLKILISRLHRTTGGELFCSLVREFAATGFKLQNISTLQYTKNTARLRQKTNKILFLFSS